MVLVVGFLMGGPLLPACVLRRPPLPACVLRRPPACLLRRTPNWYREAGWSTTRAPFLNRSRVLEKLDPQKVALATNSNWTTGIMNPPPIPEPSPSLSLPRPSFSWFLQLRSTTWVLMIVLVSVVVASLMRDIVEQILKIVAGLGAPQNGKSVSVLSFEALQRLIEKPAVQKIIYPGLPEEMRNSASLKWILQNPNYCQRLEDTLNNMGKWDDRLTDSLNSFDLGSGEVKQSFEQLKLAIPEVVKKIMADPEIASEFQNPKMLAAIIDVMEALDKALAL